MNKSILNIWNNDEVCYVVAEIGINHEGDTEKCAKLIKDCAEAGVDGVKLQSVNPDLAYSKDSLSHQIFSRARLSPEQTQQMFSYANKLGIEAFTTSGDPETLEWVDRLEPPVHKVSSGLLNCIPLLDKVCGMGRPIILSNGASDEDEITDAVKLIQSKGLRYAILQCTSEYPCPAENIGLGEIIKLKNKFACPCGFSDHSVGYFFAPLAVACGAKIIEKHVTFDRDRSSFDHHISLLPNELKKMVDDIRLAEKALSRVGEKIKRKKLEISGRISRYLALRKPLSVGDTISANDLAYIRFSDGTGNILAKEYKNVIGRMLKVNMDKAKPLMWCHFYE